MTDPAVRTVGTIRAGLGEGPVWDMDRLRLHWIDIHLCRLYTTDIATGETTWRDLPDAPGCAALTEEGDILLAMGQALVIVEQDGDLRHVAALPPGVPGRFNDGKPDHAGRFWVGTATAEGHFGCGLWRHDPGRGFALALPGVSMSNGIGWSPDRRRMYYVDSVTHRLDLLEHDPETGAIGGRRALCSVPEGQFPDGLCVDADGDIWLAVWGGACVLHLSPEGEERGRVRLPTPLVTSCAFGGPDYRTLFITTASDDADDPHAGRLFAADVGARGAAPGRVRVT